MNFIAILAALAAEQFFGNWRDDTRPDLVERLWHFVRLRAPAMVLLTAILPALLTAAVIGSLHDGLLRALLSGLILFAALGPRDIASDIQRLIAARARGEAATVLRLTRALQSGPEPECNHRSLLGALFIQSHERVFGVLLWFLALGPAGAVLYRLASRLPQELAADSAAHDTADSLHAALAFVPVRITALLFGLAGSMDDALGAWKRLRLEPHPDWRRHGWSLLAETATASAETDDEDGQPLPVTPDAAFQEVLRMQNRALLILLACAALLAAGSTFT